MAKFQLDSYFGLETFSKAFQLSFLFHKEIFSPKDLGVTYTNINYWDKQGILASRREGKSAWRNFNFVDYVWLRVVDELRALGVPVSLIKEGKNQLFEGLDLNYKEMNNYFKTHIEEIKNSLPCNNEIKEKVIENMIKEAKNYTKSDAKKDGFTYFFLTIFMALIYKCPVSLIFFNNGDYDIWIERLAGKYNKEYIEEITFETHVRVSISKIIRDFLLEERSIFLLSELPLLQPNENRLLELIHSGNYDSITINFRDKKMKNLELKKTQDTKRKIVEILNDGAYQDILIKSHKGMVTHIENTLKVMLDEK